MYKIVYSAQSEKFIRKLDTKRQVKVKHRMELVAHNPFVHDSNLEKIKDMIHGYKLRVGDIRLVYEVDSNNQTIAVWKTDWRDRIYKK